MDSNDPCELRALAERWHGTEHSGDTCHASAPLPPLQSLMCSAATFPEQFPVDGCALRSVGEATLPDGAAVRRVRVWIRQGARMKAADEKGAGRGQPWTRR